MAKQTLPPTTALYPVPVVLVSSTDIDTKKHNVITIAWCGTVCSEPPMLGISIRPSRYSHGIIKRAGSFVVNIPSSKLLASIDQCGIHSGAKIDKLEKYSLTPLAASKVSAPLIKECPVNIECATRNVISLGTHDLFIGEILSIHVDEHLIDAGGRIDYAQAMPFVYNNGEYWSLGTKIGHYGYSAKVI